MPGLSLITLLDKQMCYRSLRGIVGDFNSKWVETRLGDDGDF